MNKISTLRPRILNSCKKVIASQSIGRNEERLVVIDSKNQEDSRKDENYRRAFHISGGIAAGASLFTGLSLYAKEKENDSPSVTGGERLEGFPDFKMEEVSKHDSVENRVWVTYKNGVYDITDFIPLHPGASQLMMAAGGRVEPFWAMYAVHLNNPEVMGLLEKYRIGNLDISDVEVKKKSDSNDPYSNDPTRHPALIINNPKPFNAEIPLSIITHSFLTPNDLFYVRNHLPVPEIDPAEYELEVEGVGVKEMTLSLDKLKEFPKHTIVATVQCSGNRRAEMKAKKNLKGLEWRGGAIGNAEWSGAKLYDVLKAAGFSEEKYPDARHVIFAGLDVDAANAPYEASIPIEKAFDPRGDVLLAYEMNGETLPADHGFPVRVIVPGVAGARHVKWLGRVEVSEGESQGHWQQNDYKGFHPSTDWDTVDFSKSEAIQEMPVTSAITSCTPSEVEGEVIVSGYAWSGGGQKILRVDLTGDGGRTWTEAHTLRQDTARKPRHWGWTLWEGRLRVEEGGEVWSKAVDSNYNVQPETFENIWNLRGVLSNAYCRFKVKKEHLQGKK